MPEFVPGEMRTARAPITVQPAGLACSAELYLGARVATSGVKSFNSTGVRQDISFPLTMPDVAGTYPVYLDVAAQGILIGAYKATKDVVIMAPEKGLVAYLKNIPTSPFKWPSYYIAEPTTWYVRIYGAGWRARDSYEEREEWKEYSSQSVLSPAVFADIPPEWFPLRYRITIRGVIETEPYSGTGCIMYKVQTVDPDRRNYKELTISEYGSYYFNADTGRFEKI